MKKQKVAKTLNSFTDIFKTHDPCRKFLFKVTPVSYAGYDRELDAKLEIILTCFIREIKMNETHTTIKFMCDDKGEVFRFFKDKRQFYISALNRVGDTVFSFYHPYTKSKMYIEEFGHEKTDGLLTGVVIIERE